MTPGDVENVLSSIDDWTQEGLAVLRHLHAKAAAENQSNDDAGPWRSLERHLFGNPNKLLEEDETLGRGFSASLMDGPYVDLFLLAGLSATEQLQERLYEDHSWHSLLDECESVEKFETGETDEVPGMSDAFFWVTVDFPDHFARELRELIIGIALGV